MTELSKLFSTVLLLAVGFLGASLFGPPELAERLMGQWAAPPVSQAEGLRPLSPDPRGAGPWATPAAQVASAPVPTSPAPTSPAPTSPVPTPHAVASFVPVPLPAQPPTAWQTPNFTKETDAKETDLLSGPSADFNAWLGAAGNGSDRENAAAPVASFRLRRQDAAVAPVAGFGELAPSQATPSQAIMPQAAVAWLPPRDVAASKTAGPSLFAAAGSEQTSEQAAGDAWGVWGTNSQPDASARFPAQLGPSPLDNSRRTYEAGYAPVARLATQDNYGTHVVTDGDTLLDLAKRYWGDASRAEELYQLNRDRLDHPDLLPIGIVLRVPNEPRRTKPIVSDWSQQPPERNGPFSTVSKGTTTWDEPSRLVPLGDPSEMPARLPDAKYADEWSW